MLNRECQGTVDRVSCTQERPNGARRASDCAVDVRNKHSRLNISTILLVVQVVTPRSSLLVRSNPHEKRHGRKHPTVCISTFGRPITYLYVAVLTAGTHLLYLSYFLSWAFGAAGTLLADLMMLAVCRLGLGSQVRAGILALRMDRWGSNPTII